MFEVPFGPVPFSLLVLPRRMKEELRANTLRAHPIVPPLSRSLARSPLQPYSHRPTLLNLALGISFQDWAATAFGCGLVYALGFQHGELLR